jgi:hypothetical protein
VLLLFLREKPVAVYAYHHAVRLDGAESCFYAATTAADVVAVCRSTEIIV